MDASSPACAPTAFQLALQKAHAGDSEALGRLLNSLSPTLVALGHKQIPPRLRSKASPSDLAQDTLLDAQRDFQRFVGDAPEELAAWVMTIWRNNCWNFERSYAKGTKCDASLEEALDAGEDSCNLRERLMACCSLPQEEVEGREQSDQLEAACQQLPERYRLVVCLRGAGGSYETIGAELHCSAEAARKCWVRAVCLMRRALGRTWAGSATAVLVVPSHP